MAAPLPFHLGRQALDRFLELGAGARVGGEDLEAFLGEQTRDGLSRPAHSEDAGELFLETSGDRTRRPYQRNFSDASAVSTSTMPTIQKRTVTLGSATPLNSKW